MRERPEGIVIIGPGSAGLSYRQHIREYASMGYLEKWYTTSFS